MKYVLCVPFLMWLLSRPVWGAWIEIAAGCLAVAGAGVAPRMGRVD